MSTTSYTDNNVVYTYTVPVSGTTGTAFVDESPNATGVINILSTFVIDSVTYTVTSIGEEAFFGLVLSNVTIPNTVTTISKNAFKNTGLSSISIPDSVTTIGDSAFSNNKIETTNIGNNVVTIGANAFLANKLTTITIPDKVVTIGDSAFQNNALNNVTIIGTEVTTIGVSAFQGNNLSELFIPVSVTLIGNSAFRTNKLAKVYFFNIPTIDTNAFANNTVSITAYYVDTSTTAQINSLPTVFSSKTQMTKVEILKYQIIQGVTVQYLLADNFTLAEMIAANGSADWLLTYYSLQQLVDAGCPVSRLLLGSSVTPLDLFNCGVSVVDLKNAGANTRVMLNEFSLADLITALYTVSELKTASDSTIAPVVTDNNKVTIQKFKLANAVISQMLTAYNTGPAGLQALLAEYTVSDLYSANSSITIANFKAASADIPEMLDAYNNGSVGLAALLVEYNVSELHSAINSPSVADFNEANVSISTLISVYKIETNGLKALLEVFTVSEIHIADNTISIADFKAADTDIKQMLNVFNTDSTRLTELLLDAGYSPEQLKTASDSTVEPVVVTNRKVSLQKFIDVMVSTITLLNLYNTSLDGLIDFIQAGYSVLELKTDSSSSLVTANSKVTIERLKRASADIKLMLNEYNTDDNGLIDFISAGYNVSELKIASDSTVEPVVISGNKVTVARLKIAQANLSQMLPLYSLSLLIVADYRVKALLDAAVDANRVISLSDLASTGALLWDLMNNYSISSLLQYFRVAQLITASNEKDSNNDFKVTITAKQSLNTKAGTLKDAGADITEMMDSFSLTALVDAGYTVEELKTASPSLTATNFKTAGATAAQMLNSNKFSLTDLIGADYRVADLKTADSNITLANFVSAGAPLSDLMNAYSLYDLIHVQPVGYTVSQLIAASNEKDSNNDFKVTHIANQALDTKAGTLKNASAPIGEMIVAFSLTDLLAADYRVAELKTADSTLSLTDFVSSGALLWDLMNNYTLSELVNYPFSVSQLITASNEKVNGVYKITDIVNQALDTKAGTLKAASAPIGQMIDAFELTDLLAAGYIVKDLKDGSVNSTTTLTISSFKTANASVAQMINAYSLFDLIHVEPQGYTVEQLINASNETVNGVYKVTDIANQALDTKPKTLKDAGALISQMVYSFSLQALLSSPVNYTVAELKVVNGVTLSNLNSAFVNMGFTIKARLDNLYNEFSLKELNTLYIVSELANYTKADSNIVDLTVADFKAITEPSVSPAQMVAYFTISELYNGGYTVQYIVTNGNSNMTIQDIIYDGSVPLWAVLNYVGPQLGYYRKNSSGSELLPISDLMNAVSDTNSNYKSLKVYDFYIGTNPSHPKPNDVPTYVNGSTEVSTRNNQIREVATLVEILRIKHFGIQGDIIDIGPYITNIALKNLTVADFNAAAKLDRVWMYENRLSNFIQQFNLSDLVNDWSVYELKTKGSAENLPPGSGYKAVTLQELKVANAPAWDMLNNYTLSDLVLSEGNRNKYTSAELVTASKEKVNNVYKVTVVDNRDITVSKLKTAGAFVYDLMNHFDLADLFLGGCTVAELITASNLRYWIDSNYEYRVTRIEYQKLGQLGTHVSLTQAELNTGAAKLKQANAPIGEMTSSVDLTTLVAVGYGVAELKTANPSYTIQNFAEASTPILDMLNSYKFYNLYDYYTISELRTASESSLVTDEDNKNLSIAKFKNSNPPAPIWKMLNAYLLSQLTPYYTATELIDNSKSWMNGGNIVNEPNANLELADLDRIEELWELMNTAPDKFRYIDFLVIGYTVKELYDELQLKDDNGNYKVTTHVYWLEFSNIRAFYYGTLDKERSTFLYYTAQAINTYDLIDILRVNYDNGPFYAMRGDTVYPVADILDAQAQYGSATTVDELGQPIIASNKEVTLSSLVNAIKSFPKEEWIRYINPMINYYRYANGTDSIQNALNIMFSQSGLKPKDLLTYGYDNLFDSENKPTKVIIFKAAAVGTSITSSDIYEAFSIYELLSAYTITEINTIRVNLATPLPILTVDEILNLMAVSGDVNTPQPYYDKIRDDLVNLVKNGTFSYSLSDVYSNAANYYRPGIGSVRYISANYFKDTFTVSQLKNAGANLIDMVYAYYLNEYYVNRGLEPPVETSPAGLTELLTLYSVSEIGPIRTFLDTGNQNDWMIKLALVGFPIRLFKAAGADIKQMLNYFNTLNIYGQTSDPNLQNNTDGLYWLLYFGYTVSELKAASESTTGTIVDNDKKVTVARFHQVSADHKQMLTAYNTDSDGLKALLVKYNVSELKTASDSVVSPVVPADKKVSIKKFYDADANVVDMLDVYNTGSVGLKALLVEYTVSELHSASNSPSIADFKAADADYVEMLTAFNTGSVGLAALLVEYTVSQLHSASNSPSIANFEAANADVKQMLTAYNIDTDGLKDLLVTYTVPQLKTASVDASVTVDKKVTIAKFKLAGADVWQMLNNYILSDLVISGSFATGYTTRVLVTASSDSRVTVIGNKNISLTTIIAAGAPLYDLMNYYTLSQLVAVPYSVSQLITASKLKDSNDVYKVTVTAYQELDSDAGAVTLKAALALIGQMVVAFSLTQLIKADYRVSALKTANSAYTISDFKTAVVPLWDMLNNYYDIVDLLYNGYTIAELKLASEDSRTISYRNLNGDSFVGIVIRKQPHPFLDYTGLAADILNYFTLYEVTNPGWAVSELITYSRDSRVTNVKSNKNLVLNDFKTRSYKPTWDILVNYSLAEMVTAGYTVAELKTTIPYNSVGPIPSNHRVTITSLKAAGSVLSDIINNYTVQELANESSTVGSYTLTQLVETSNLITAVPLVIDSRKVTLARLLALSPVPPLTYLLSHYTTLQLVGGGVSPLSLANVNPTILEEVVAIGFLVKLKTPRLLNASVTSGVVALNLNQATGSDVSIDKYFVSYSSNNGRTFTPLAVLMNTTVTPNVPQLGNTLYVSGLQTNKFYSFRIMASSGSVNSSISNTLKNVFVG